MTTQTKAGLPSYTRDSVGTGQNESYPSEEVSV
jgi:hypothetical protein